MIESFLKWAFYLGITKEMYLIAWCLLQFNRIKKTSSVFVCYVL